MGDELQIVEVLSWVDKVWFDLVSKNIIPADKYRGYPARYFRFRFVE